MKEKVSCSLDGDLIDVIDDLIDDFPTAGSRSAVIEMSLYAFIDRASILSSAGLDWDDLFIYKMIERRCKLNAQKESKNRNV